MYKTLPKNVISFFSHFPHFEIFALRSNLSKLHVSRVALCVPKSKGVSVSQSMTKLPIRQLKTFEIFTRGYQIHIILYSVHNGVVTMSGV